MAQVYIRTCQSCDHEQKMKPPNPNDKQEKWRDAVCRKCGSEGLDYGGYKLVPPYTPEEQATLDRKLKAMDEDDDS